MKAFRFFSRSLSRVSPLKYSFRSSASFNKKLGVGEASAVLEEKISKISQIVFTFNNDRTILKSMELLFPLEMVLQECSDLPKFKQEKWLILRDLVLEEWH